MRNKLKLATIYSERAKKIAATVSTNAADNQHSHILLRRARRLIGGADEKDQLIVSKIERNVRLAYIRMIKNSESQYLQPKSNQHIDEST